MHSELDQCDLFLGSQSLKFKTIFVLEAIPYVICFSLDCILSR